MTSEIHPDSGPATPPRRRLDRITSSVIARFASVGVVNTLVDFGLYVVLFWLGAAPVVANFFSTSAGMAVSFAGNRRFVFGATDNRVREVSLFVVVCGLGIWVIQPVVIAATSAALSHYGEIPALLLAAVPKTAAILVAAVWNYLLYRRLVFRDGVIPAEGRD